MAPRRSLLPTRAETLVITAVVLAVAGLWLVTRPVSTAYGWFADSPLTGQVPRPGGVLVTTSELAGGLLLALAIAVGAGLLGWRLGQRSSEAAGPPLEQSPAGD